MAAKLYRHEKTQATLEFISFHGSDYAMCRDSQGRVEYFALKDLVEYEVGKGVTGVKPVSPVAEEEEEKIEERRPTAIPMETRLNINLATPELIADRLHGIGYSTAKKIVEKRSSLPGERFSSMEQLRETTNRVDWDAIFKADQVFVG